jgi:hypothetical protein
MVQGAALVCDDDFEYLAAIVSHYRSPLSVHAVPWSRFDRPGGELGPDKTVGSHVPEPKLEHSNFQSSVHTVDEFRATGCRRPASR